MLDVGCGSGWALRLLETRGIAAERLHGVDLSPARVRAAQRALAGADISVADARTLPMQDGSIQAVLFITALSSMADKPDRVLALREARRVLRGDGVAIWYEPRVPNPTNRNTRLVSVDEAREAGFVVAGSSTLTPLPPLTRRLGRLTDRAFPVLAGLPALRTHRLVELRPG